MDLPFSITINSQFSPKILLKEIISSILCIIEHEFGLILRLRIFCSRENCEFVLFSFSNEKRVVIMYQNMNIY